MSTESNVREKTKIVVGRLKNILKKLEEK
ncbi:hypothetical protein NARC_30200 [Candidatus Nitrosocosmicus arcticus]|uniref:Uncharacterized protein n=1 Tax=Candidatus Nitrosocosmicus arcticus TaxID=2035267 RepID=A0A557SY07_9ARCH|nr:hypothetical protein NARC_30200 [Candidatus Nitrosocosmicus arcticus]